MAATSATAVATARNDTELPPESLHRPPRQAGRLTWAGRFLGALAVALGFFAALFLIFQFVGEERDRAIAEWRARLTIVADSRLDAVQTWVRAQKAEIRGLARNESLRLYIAAISDPSAGRDAPERQFLRNLLRATARRAGYLGSPANRVPANLSQDEGGGLAILDKDGKPLVATDGMPALESGFRRFIRAARTTGVHVYDLHEGPGGKPALGLVSPVAGPAGGVIAWIVGLRPVGHELYPLLKQPGASGRSAEAILVRPDGGILEYISPLANGTAPFRLKLAVNTPDLAAATAAGTPGVFFIGRDYAGHDVLGVSRKVKGVPWVLIYKIDQAEALGQINDRLSRLLIILLMGLLLVIVAILAVWRHGASRRASLAAGAYRRAAEELEQQRNLLRVVTDHQPEAIFIVDDKDDYRFANMAAARGTGLRPDDLIGKTLTTILGPRRARRYERLNRQALDTNKAVVDVARIEDGEEAQFNRVVQSKHVPLPAASGLKRSVLVVEEDITAAIDERERRVRNLRSLVQALVTVIDRRDPNAAHHSIRVSVIARAIATEMGLERRQVDAAGFAGDLLNIGKLMVPQDLLTRPGKLTGEEMKRVQAALESGPDLLAGIEFDGPVVDTIRQARERWDGKGTPKRLKGQEILLTARIVAVANAFVAMASPRAHRPAQSVDDVLTSLLRDVGKAYDRRVVAALANYLDNKGGRETWTRISSVSSRTAPPGAAAHNDGASGDETTGEQAVRDRASGDTSGSGQRAD